MAFKFPKDTIYKRARCQECEHEVSVRADKNGNPFYICLNCSTRHQISGGPAIKIVAAYEEQQKIKAKKGKSDGESDDENGLYI